MRKHPDKKYGYVILPIGIPAGMTPEEALSDHQRYKVVWQVLQALRAHDDRFNAMVNKIDLNKDAAKQIEIIGVGGGDSDWDDGDPAKPEATQIQFSFPQMDAWRDAILAKLVQKVGDRRYWEDWAKDIAQIAERHVTRIQALLNNNNTKLEEEFDAFLHGLQGNLNDSITRDDAIEMLAQHLITKPVFDALFEDYSFAAANPVSQVMQRMLDALDEHALEKESETLDKFYESVRMRASGIDNAEGKQRIIIELYEKFFKNAFPRVADKLGIVYTPIEVVDYILNSVQAVLKSEFDTDLSAEEVHVLDPFTGTGTFIARLIQSGLIDPKAMERKYRKELHANEIVLLAYYIAAINIEATYHGVHGGKYEPFDGIVLTDTFQMYEDGDADDKLIFPINNERVEAQKKAPIRVIVGNPPYSVGQGSENDGNKNVVYPTLDNRIRQTYTERSTGTNLNSLYDSYIRAFRWASDRIGDHGVIAYITNGGWLDNTAMDGFRKTLDAEFSSLWVFNLRGNARTSGIRAKEEGENVFPIRTPVAITLLIKKESHTGPCEIHYQNIGDYLKREEKLTIIETQKSVSAGVWETLTPNDSGDWINQRDEEYGSYQVLGDKKDNLVKPMFETYSLGLKTQRDAWMINSSRAELATNAERMINEYKGLNGELGQWCVTSGRQRDDAATEEFTARNNDESRINWTVNLKADLRKGNSLEFDETKIVTTMYRPFFKQKLYFDRRLNERVYQLPKFFPSAEQQNLVIHTVGAGSPKVFSALMLNVIPDLSFWGSSTSQGFPLYAYERVDADASLFDDDIFDGYRRRDAITDHTLNKYHNQYGSDLTKEDIFYFVYGILNSREYVEKYQADLSKMIPRIPLVKDFWGFSKAGRSLAQWHLNYEIITPHELEGLPPAGASPSSLRVEKMRFSKDAADHGKSAIVMNGYFTLSGIPEDSYKYSLAGRSAIEWLIDRYQVKTDKASGILNDPNLYSDDPRYIIDLVARMVRVSMESVAIIDSLPKLEIIE
jgi:predicted helicase